MTVGIVKPWGHAGSEQTLARCWQDRRRSHAACRLGARLRVALRERYKRGSKAGIGRI